MKGNWAHLLLEMMMKAVMLVIAALVRLLSLLSPLCPPVLSSFDFSVSEMNELRKYWDCYLPRQDHGRETWSTIRFVADYQLFC
ncbi:hypothetical protein Peur_062576 [Populus x canadensis]